jgi:hypothetical protein
MDSRLVDLIRTAHNDIVLFNSVWNLVIESAFPLSPWSLHPLNQLQKYIHSFRETCTQLILSLNNLENYSSKESSNDSEFYVRNYFYDFVSRLKTATDLIALIINQVYCLEVENKKCSLEAGPLTGRLKELRSSELSAIELAILIDKARQSWLKIFDELRDLVVHRQGIEFMGAGDHKHPIHIFMPLPVDFPFNQPFSYDQENPLPSLSSYGKGSFLINFVLQLESRSVSNYLTIDPVILTEELWKKFREVTTEIDRLMCPDSEMYIDRNKLPGG